MPNMKEKIYDLSLSLDWKLIRIISQIDRFDASWSTIERREGLSLKQLKSIATIQSVGASTRIEGSKMSDAEVEVLLSKIDISKIEDRDSQEVVGYFNVLDLISDSYDDIDISEGSIKNLHNLLLKLSAKDDWHRGDYKKLTNAVEASFPDGTRQIIFRTTEPGFPTEEAMQQLITWYESDNEVHELIKTAVFAYDFVSIHPFQDGNGRLSRLLTTLLLLKSGYHWIQYVSLEHEIERRKKDYYRVLRNCQAQRPNEDITEWVNFFLESLVSVQQKLEEKMSRYGIESDLSPKEKSILTYINDHPGCKSGEIAESLGIPNPTIKRILSEMVYKGLIARFGKGAGTNYSAK
jgi:Fic family protein